MNNAKKSRKTVEWERLEISSKKLDTKGLFHAKMGTIKDRNGMDLTEADQPWDFFGRNDAKAETPVLWPPHEKS